MKNIFCRLTFAQREEISRGIYNNESFSAIAKRINRSTSTISREVANNTKYKGCYRAEAAEKKSISKRRRHVLKKLDTHSRLCSYVHEKLRSEWSPEEIANRIKLDYPQDMTMRISHEAIYRYLYCLPKGELKAQLTRGLRQ